MQHDNRGYLAGVAVLCAIIILVFWRWRRQVGAERRRLGEMMGLRIRTDEMLEVLEVVQRKRWGTG
jgi:hypothetical protein